VAQNLVIGLENQHLGAGPIRFLRAEIMTEYPARCAWIHYSVNGREQEGVLRLDLLKQAFLDHFYEDELKEKVIQEATPRLIEILYSALPPSESDRSYPTIHSRVDRDWKSGNASDRFEEEEAAGV
jgi:hypothetical protein